MFHTSHVIDEEDQNLAIYLGLVLIIQSMVESNLQQILSNENTEQPEDGLRGSDILWPFHLTGSFMHLFMILESGSATAKDDGIFHETHSDLALELKMVVSQIFRAISILDENLLLEHFINHALLPWTQFLTHQEYEVS